VVEKNQEAASMNNVCKAIALACEAHADQLDKSGQPYILHPLRLMLKFKDEDERVVAVLHDVIEDSAFSLDHFRSVGFSEHVIEAVQCLTKETGEAYEDFIVRLSVNKLARKVKIEDIKDNLDVTRLERLGGQDLSRIEKYHKALRYLLSVE